MVVGVFVLAVVPPVVFVVFVVVVVVFVDVFFFLLSVALVKADSSLTEAGSVGRESK